MGAPIAPVERPAPPRQAPAHEQLLRSTTAVQLRHREKISAGVPGCTCGHEYPEDSHGRYLVLHARHVAGEAIRHVLQTAIDTIGADPTEWGAADAIAILVGPPEARDRKEEP